MLYLDETNAWLENCLPRLQAPLDRLDETAIDALLNSRDEVPFDGHWTDTDAAFEAHKRTLPQATLDELARFSDDQRRQVYQSVIRASGSPDLAAYVSDDFGLIVEAKALRWQHDFVDSLSTAYQTGNIPCEGMSKFCGG